MILLRSICVLRSIGQAHSHGRPRILASTAFSVGSRAHPTTNNSLAPQQTAIGGHKAGAERLALMRMLEEHSAMYGVRSPARQCQPLVVDHRDDSS